MAATALTGCDVALTHRYPRSAGVFSGLAVVAGFGLGYWLLAGPPVFPPRDPVQWVPWLAGAAWGVFSVLTVGRGRRAAPALWQAGFTFAATALLLAPLLGRQPLAWLPVAAASALLWLIIWRYLDGRRSRRSTGGLLMAVAAGHAIVAALGGSTLLGQLSMALAAALGGWLTWNLYHRGPPLGHAGVATGTLLLGSLMLLARVYADTPLPADLWLLGAFAADGVGAFIIDRRWAGTGNRPARISAGVALIPVAVAVATAVTGYLGAGGGG